MEVLIWLVILNGRYLRFLSLIFGHEKMFHHVPHPRMLLKPVNKRFWGFRRGVRFSHPLLRDNPECPFYAAFRGFYFSENLKALKKTLKALKILSKDTNTALWHVQLPQIFPLPFCYQRNNIFVYYYNGLIHKSAQVDKQPLFSICMLR